MSGEVQATINVNTEMPALDWLTGLGYDYLSLFKQEPKILFCIVFAFLAAQLTHVILRGYFPEMRRLTQGLIISASHIVVGATVAHYFLNHLGDVEFYKWFTGVNSILAYHALMLTGKWLKQPWLVQLLSLRISKVVIDKNTGKPIVEMGETVKFLRK